MIKGILIDLGKTILTNEDFSFQRGLITIYNKYDYINNNVSLNVFLNKANSYLYLYKEREITNIEIPFYKYIKLIFNDLNIELRNFDDLEYSFLKGAIVDNLIENVTTFLEYTKKQNIPVLIVSNSTFSKKALLRQLEELNLAHYFVDLISSCDVSYRKPSREIFEFSYNIISKYTNSACRDEILFIGNDYELDVLGSLNANLIPVFFNQNNLPYDKNIYSFNNYLNLIEHLKKIKN